MRTNLSPLKRPAAKSFTPQAALQAGRLRSEPLGSSGFILPAFEIEGEVESQEIVDRQYSVGYREDPIAHQITVNGEADRR